MEKRRPPRVLLLGSEPFGGLTRNPSADLIDHFNALPPGEAEIIGIVLPVSYDALPARITSLIEEHDPDVVLGLGLFVGAAYVRVETTAINVADFDVADNNGVFLRGSALESGGPEARFATYDAVRLARAMRDNGIPARVSHHAGTHLCNLTLYTVLKVLTAIGRTIPTGFIHLPLLPKQAAELIESEEREERFVRPPLEHPTMDLAVQKAAVAIAIAELTSPPLHDRPGPWSSHLGLGQLHGAK